MKKSTKIVRKLLALFLVVLMSIESFGALVSDNDGSAFITKGEFDSLKSDFQTQINNYNTSLDNKIDGAIAAYLAGISVKTKPYVMLESLKKAIGHDLRFFNSYPVGTTLTTRYIVIKEKSYSITYKDASGGWQPQSAAEWVSENGDKYVRGISFGWQNMTDCYVHIWSGNDELVNFKLTDATSWVRTSFVWGADSNTANIVNESVTNSASCPTSWNNNNYSASANFISQNVTGQANQHYHYDISNFGAMAVCQTILRSKAFTVQGNTTISAAGVDSVYDTGGYLVPSVARTPHYLFQTTWDRAGAGSCWVSELNPNGNRRLLGYRTNYPLVVLNLSSKWWQDKGTVTLADGTFNFTTAHNHTINLPSTWTFSTSGTHYTSYNTNNNSWWYQMICNLYTEAMQNTFVQVDQFGYNTDTVLKYIDLYAQPNYVNETIASNLSYAQSTHTIEGYSASLGAINMTVSPSGKGVGLTVDEAPMNYFENIYLTAIAGETVWMGCGAPLMEMQSPADTEYKITMKLKLYDSSGNPAGATGYNQAYVMLSKNKFWNGLFVAAEDILFDDTITFDSTGNATLEIDNFTGVDKGKKVWYNLSALNNGYYVVCTDCDVTVK